MSWPAFPSPAPDERLPFKLKRREPKLKNRRPTPAPSTKSATVAEISLPSELLDFGPIPGAEFRRIVQSAQQGNLTASDFARAIRERQRATSKRKNAVIAGKPGDAASASSREQEIVRMLDPYIGYGVRAQPGRKEGGRATGKKKRQQGAATRLKVHELASGLLLTHPPREISGIIMLRLKLSRQQVLRHLHDHPSRHWEKKVT